MKCLLRFVSLVVFIAVTPLIAEPLVYEGAEGPGKGQHIVFVANDHEYRSEQTCPLLAKILAKHYGFKCTVLFGINAEGFIEPGAKNLPGLEILPDADLLVFYTRFLNLPDEQVDHLVDYFERGGPVVALRTSSHAFNGQKGKWAKLNFNYQGKDYPGGLGKQILGNTWAKTGQQHYGDNHVTACRITPAESGVGHAILAGVRSIHAFSGAYSSPVPDGATSLLDLQVLTTFWPSESYDTEKPIVTAAWVRDSYVAPSGEEKKARVMYTSIGASEDFLDEDARRLLVNGCFWALGREEIIKPYLNVSIVGGFSPSPYATSVLYSEGVLPTDLSAWDSQIMPTGKTLRGLKNPNVGESHHIYRSLISRNEFREMLEETVPGFDRTIYKPRPAK